MAETPQAPNEEQLTQAKATADAEIARWQGDFTEEELAVSYKREDKKTKATDEETEDGVETEAPQTADETSKEPEETDKQLETFSEPEPVVTVADPGEYTPADYSFEVTLADGKTHKISTMEDAEKLAEDPENFETPKQLLDFIRKSQKMENKLDKDYEKWEQQKQTFTEQLQVESDRRETVDNYEAEFTYLINKGLVPAVSREFIDADWSDPEVAKQPGVRDHLAILTYMVQENKERAKAGVKPLDSIVDAFNAMQADPTHKKTETAKKDDAEKKAQAEARKAAGARVAGVSASQQGSYVPKGIAVGNPNVLKRGASLWDD